MLNKGLNTSQFLKISIFTHNFKSCVLVVGLVPPYFSIKAFSVVEISQ